MVVYVEESKDDEQPLTLDITSLDTYSLLALFANILSAQAWQHMGLRVKPGSDQIERDLERARTAIDCVAFLLNKLEAHVPESEGKRLNNLLTDLQINFVRITKD